MTRRSIVQKYREGRLKITLKRKLKETEIAGGEAVKGPVLVEIYLYIGVWVLLRCFKSKVEFYSYESKATIKFDLSTKP